MKNTVATTIEGYTAAGLRRERLRRLAVLATRIAISAFLAVFLTNCKKMVPVSKSEFGSLEQKGKARVITITGEEYEYLGFRIADKKFQGFGGKVVGSKSVVPPPQQIPLTEITTLKVEKLDMAKSVLLGAGIAAGTVAIIVAATKGKDDPPPPPPRSLSCPFVFSFDGTHYRFDSETFAGAIFAGAERADYDNLDFLAPVDGEYRLRIQNEREETQYTNKLAVLVVDHPPGTRVVPDSRGVIHALSKPTPADSAVDSRGNEVLELLRTSDDRFWESELTRMDVAAEQHFRDGVILTFRKPPEARQAKLFVRARNTELGALALRAFLELQGDELYQWYQEANTSESLQQRIKQWYFRDGMLHIRVWQQGRWVLQDALLDVGPAISKDQVASLDLSGVEGEEVRVQLESSLGLWRLDTVTIDYESSAPVSVTELAAHSAETHDGRDVRELLLSDDGDYYIALPGDKADLVFKEPPRHKDHDRSYVLETKGFYYIYANDSGVPRPDLVNGILAESKVAAGYFLPRWQEIVEAQRSAD